jgi:hypothetical protein
VPSAAGFLTPFLRAMGRPVTINDEQIIEAARKVFVRLSLFHEVPSRLGMGEAFVARCAKLCWSGSAPSGHRHALNALRSAIDAPHVPLKQVRRDAAVGGK